MGRARNRLSVSAFFGRRSSVGLIDSGGFSGSNWLTTWRHAYRVTFIDSESFQLPPMGLRLGPSDHGS
jgi:hypothetical protein